MKSSRLLILSLAVSHVLVFFLGVVFFRATMPHSNYASHAQVNTEQEPQEIKETAHALPEPAGRYMPSTLCNDKASVLFLTDSVTGETRIAWAHVNAYGSSTCVSGLFAPFAQLPTPSTSVELSEYNRVVMTAVMKYFHNAPEIEADAK